MMNYISMNGNSNNRPEMLPTGTLSILDVGHGNSAVLKDTDGIVVIDAGPKSGLVAWHVANADNPDPRFRGDADWAKRFLVEWVATGWITEAEANEIRRMVGWEVTAVQLQMELPMT